MKIFSLLAVVAFALAAMPDSAEAGRRVRCSCAGKEKSWVHHTFACEYHFKKAFSKSGSGGMKPAQQCSLEEWTQFRTYLCVGERCMYQ